VPSFQLYQETNGRLLKDNNPISYGIALCLSASARASPSYNEQRMVALKNILVALYGTTGSFWNRLANVDTFEEINRLSREILIKSKDIVQGLGYELLYADTDSVFLKKSGATLDDFVSVKDILGREIGLPLYGR
jgi:hypothetical protein